MPEIQSVFAQFQPRAYPHTYRCGLHVTKLVGGIPSNENVAAAWIAKKLGRNPDDAIRAEAARVIIARGLKDDSVNRDQIAQEINENRHLNGFKRDEHGLYIEGRQLKACLKEAASIAVNAEKLNGKNWGLTNKTLLNWLPEHIFVVEDRLYLGVNEPTGVMQRFVQTFRGSGISYDEYVDDAKIHCTIACDYPIDEEKWAMIWLTAEMNGLGASRSQGYGRFKVTDWIKL